MNKTTVPIRGMHCHSCEILIEEELKKVSHVHKVHVSQKRGEADVYHADGLDMLAVETAVKDAGYSVGIDTPKPWFSPNGRDYLNLGRAFLTLTILYFAARGLGLLDIGTSISSNNSSLWGVLLIGLTAGVSTCMALVGGLVLGASARFAEKHPFASSTEKFKPHLFFNLGRILGFFVLGAVIGSLGSIFKLTPEMQGFLMIAAGLFMLLLGVQLTEISPKLNSVSLTLPKGLSRLLGISNHANKEYSHKGSMILGALTFFLPCGFTQAMQILAISSGSASRGALIMGLFAIGTAPGLLGVGGLTAIIKGGMAKPFFRTVGLAVAFLALFNISNGYNLTGLNLVTISWANSEEAVTEGVVSDPNVTLENGYQVVRMTQGSFGYSPNRFTIKKGVPVKWLINSTNANSCASSVVSSALNIRQFLNAGENEIDFTPLEVGQIRFSCSMGMYSGSFNVIDGSGESSLVQPIQAAVQPVQQNNAPAPAAGCGGAGGGGGCGGCGGGVAKNVQPTTGQTEKLGDTQIIKATYTLSKDIQPNQFTVKAGIPVSFKVAVRENGSGCMGSLAIPGLSNQVESLDKGQDLTFDFTPTKPGQYKITCAMGVPRGTLTVI